MNQFRTPEEVRVSKLAWKGQTCQTLTAQFQRDWDGPRRYHLRGPLEPLVDSDLEELLLTWTRELQCRGWTEVEGLTYVLEPHGLTIVVGLFPRQFHG